MFPLPLPGGQSLPRERKGHYTIVMQTLGSGVARHAAWQRLRLESLQFAQQSRIVRNRDRSTSNANASASMIAALLAFVVMNEVTGSPSLRNCSITGLPMLFASAKIQDNRPRRSQKACSRAR